MKGNLFIRRTVSLINDKGGAFPIERPEDDRHPVLPRSLAEIAWIETREQILTGRLAPGAPISLKEHADRLGLSVMPVREALQRLHQEGLVVHEPQRGAIVAPLSVDHMEDIYRVRIALEGLAIELACERFGQEQHEAFSRTLDRFIEAYESGDLRAGRELHRRFHVDLYALAGSPALNRLIPPLLDGSERYRVLSVGVRGSAAERRREHREILDACLLKDVRAARQLLTEHLARTVALVRKAFEPSGAGADPPGAGKTAPHDGKE